MQKKNDYIRIIFEKLNQEKQNALSIENIFIHAGAGTGKTHILIHRILYLLLTINYCDLNDIVAVTFTKKAAKEIKIRLVHLFNQVLHDYSNSLQDWQIEKLKHCSHHMQEAEIGTIHSFLQRRIRENSQLFQLNKQFVIINSIDKEIELNRIIQKFISQQLIKDNSTNPLFKSVSKTELIGIIKQALNRVDVLRNIGVEHNPIHNIENLKNDFFAYLSEKIKSDPLIFNFINTCQFLNKCNSTSKEFSDFAEGLDFHRFNILYNQMFTKQNEFRKNLIKELNESQMSICLDFHLPLMEFYKKFASFYSFDCLVPDEFNGFLIEIMNLIKTIYEDWQRIKNEKDVLEYNDLELMFLSKIESDSSFKNQMRKRFKFYFIDEFQDTSPIQWTIFHHLLHDNQDEKKLAKQKSFFVGDPKQSIYGFRSADVQIFNEVNSIFEKNDDSIVYFESNYRSKSQLIHFVNYFAEHYFPIYDNEFNVAFHPLKKEEDLITDTGKIQVFISEKSEYEFIVNQIGHLIKDNYSFKDIAILFRSRPNSLELFQLLKLSNIPFINYLEQNFLDEAISLDIINYLRLMLNIHNDLAMIAVLKSPFYSLRDSEIESMKTENKSIFDSLLNSDVFQTIIQQLTTDLIYIRTQSIINFVNYLITERNYFYQLSEFQFPIYFQAAKKCYELISQLCKNNRLSLSELIENLEYFKKTAEFNEEAIEIDESRDAVKIMTIHASKGLEFPIVFIPNCHKEAGRKFASDFFYHPTCGIWSRKFNDDDSKSFISAYHDFIQKEKDISEHKRLLYVAMTRAKDQLFFTATKADKIRAASFLDFIDKSFSLSLLENQSFNNGKFEFSLISTMNDKANILQLERETENHNRFESRWNKPTRTLFSFTKIQQFYSDQDFYLRKYIFGDFLSEFRNENNVKISKSDGDSKLKNNFPAHFYGNVFHKIVQECLRYKRFDLDLLEKLFRKLSISVEMQATLQLEISAFFSHVDSKEILASTYCEFEKIIVFSLDSDSFQAKFDLLYENDNGFVILDFKTNRHQDLDSIFSHSYDQLLFYALALSKLKLKQRIFPVRLYSAYHQEFKDHQFDKNDLDDFERTLHERINTMKNAIHSMTI